MMENGSLTLVARPDGCSRRTLHGIYSVVDRMQGPAGFLNCFGRHRPLHSTSGVYRTANTPRNEQSREEAHLLPPGNETAALEDYSETHACARRDSPLARYASCQAYPLGDGNLLNSPPPLPRSRTDGSAAARPPARPPGIPVLRLHPPPQPGQEIPGHVSGSRSVWPGKQYCCLALVLGIRADGGKAGAQVCRELRVFLVDAGAAGGEGVADHDPAVLAGAEEPVGDGRAPAA
jgi:hypothetical protein